MLGVGGVLLVAVTFLDWYGVDGSNGGDTAWEAFAVLDVYLAVVGVWAIVTAVMAAAHNTPPVPLAMASLLTLMALVALVAVTVRAIDPPDFNGIAVVTEGSGDVTRLAGLWLGLAAVAFTTAGAFVSIRDERFPEGARQEVSVETIPPPEGGKA